MINKIQQFLKDQRGVPTPYRFWRDTGISRPIAYELWNDPRKLPDARSYSRICEQYQAQLSDFIVWVSPSSDEVFLVEGMNSLPFQGGLVGSSENSKLVALTASPNLEN